MMLLIDRSNCELLFACDRTVIALNLYTGEDRSVDVPKLNLPPSLTKSQENVLKKEERRINSIGVSRTGGFIAVTTENKQVIVFDPDLVVVKNFVIARVASKVTFTLSNDILIADKTGDVYLYRLADPKNLPVLLLGHLSIILDIVVSKCGKYVITCDRDEKIRVSHFPNTYDIESYCLGHQQFVTGLKIIDNILVSASGDGTVRFWDFVKGKQLHVIDTNRYIEDSTVVDSFAKEMDIEKVDVTALPISSLQIYQKEDVLFLAISLHSYHIQLHKIHLTKFESVLVKTFEFSQSMSFYLCEHLYIVSNCELAMYHLDNEKNTEELSNKLKVFYNKYKNVLQIAEHKCITALYKRKFDNVQEYLERKKMRLESGDK